MDERVIRAMAKWPKVPAVYGWLGLDRRGRWRLDGGVVRNRNTVEAINRNYASDQEGGWYYQNGPQRAYVDLEYTPWVYVLDGEDRLRTHTDSLLSELKRVWLDDENQLLLESEHGIGVVSDRDLDAVIERACDVKANPLELEVIESVLAEPRTTGSTGIYFRWAGNPLPIDPTTRAEVVERYRFQPRPRDPGSASRSE